MNLRRAFTFFAAFAMAEASPALDTCPEAKVRTTSAEEFSVNGGGLVRIDADSPACAFSKGQSRFSLMKLPRFAERATATFTFSSTTVRDEGLFWPVFHVLDEHGTLGREIVTARKHGRPEKIVLELEPNDRYLVVFTDPGQVGRPAAMHWVDDRVRSADFLETRYAATGEIYVQFWKNSFWCRKGGNLDKCRPKTTD